MPAVSLALRSVLLPARRLDRVFVASGLIVAVLLVVSPAQALSSLGFTAESLVAIAPFLLLSILVAAYAGASGLDRLAGRAFRGQVVAMILAASALGALSPFCSCGVIPVIAALLAAGMPLPPVMAFWIASPLMSPEAFILTASTLGPTFAVAKTTAAIALGLLSGFATLGLQRAGGLRSPLRGLAVCPAAARSVSQPEGTAWRFWSEAARRAAFVDTLRSSGLFLGKWMLFAFLIESLMLAYLPAEEIGAWLGDGSAWAIPAAVLAGVPAYLNGYAAIPTVAGLMEMGMAPGAALAFMTAGGVTSIPAALAVFALVRRPVFAWYLVLALVGSMATGFAFQAYLAL